ncbi:TPM domain-containing protein, partial [Salmonella enterica]|nr:TPM domain-containing protein [Salmonella enterica]
LLVVAKNDRRVRIEVGYGLEGAIPDAIAVRVIQEYLVPRFRQGDYAGGIVDATAALVRLIDGEPLPPPMADHAPAADGGGSWVLALFAA